MCNPNPARSEGQVKADLERHLRNAGSWEVVIVVALVMEAVFLWSFHSDKSTCEKVAYTIADLAVAAGVYGALRSERKAGKDNDELQRLSTERVAEANLKAEEARRKADEGRLELEKYKAPRVLSVEQIGRIAGAVSPFPNTEFVATVNSWHPEMMEFIRSVISALRLGLWKQVASPNPVQTTEVEPPLIGTGAKNRNVLVVVNSVRPEAEIPSMVEAGKTLAKALEAEGVEATIEVWDRQLETWYEQLEPSISTIIEVLIGPKA